MNPILTAVLLLCILGIIGSVLLVAAAKFLAVSEDERVQQLQSALPGANCGGCGYAGCSSYAKAIAEGAPVNLCPVGGQAVAERLAAIMGVEAGAATQHKAVVACQTTVLPPRYDYQGISSCKACNTLYLRWDNNLGCFTICCLCECLKALNSNNFLARVCLIKELNTIRISFLHNHNSLCLALSLTYRCFLFSLSP